jgi:hypothetical protein
MRRRGWLLGALGLSLGLPLASWSASAAERAPVAVPAVTHHGPAIAPLPLSIAVAEVEGKPVVDERWLEQQVAWAQRLLAPHGLRVERFETRRLPAPLAKLETRDDRDRLAAHIAPRVINVFIVASLRDVDDPRLLRQGVRWRYLRNLKKNYVIVAAYADPTTLTHELGHFFGNGHSGVVNNIMSYKRNDRQQVFFDAAQGRRMRREARGLLGSRRVRSLVELQEHQKSSP